MAQFREIGNCDISISRPSWLIRAMLPSNIRNRTKLNVAATRDRYFRKNFYATRGNFKGNAYATVISSYF